MPATSPIHIRPVAPSDHEEIVAELTRHWGGSAIWSIGRRFEADRLPGFVANVDERWSGLVTIHLEDGGWQCEVVTLSSRKEDRGVGSALLRAAEQYAAAAGCARIFLTTTNDNLRAIGFYQRRGWRLAQLHAGIVERARAHKPEIPLQGLNGIEVRDELEFEKWLGKGA